MFNNHGDTMALGSYNNANLVHGMQGRHLGAMAGDIMGAIQNENEARVAQMRERQRLEHEKQMKQMELNALIQRLEMERKARRSQGGDGMGFEYDPVTRRWDRW